MDTNPCLTNFVGYECFRVAFAVALCGLPVVLYSYTIWFVLVCIVYRIIGNVWKKLMTTPIKVEGRSVLITGCDTGLGFAFAKCLDQQGFVVFAGCLNDQGEGAVKLRAECSKRVHVLYIDVTKDDVIHIAFQYVKKNLPKEGLWGVVNNAGVNMLGHVEVTPVHIYERAFNVNLYGAIRVTKQFLPLIRRTKGRIVNISSCHGRVCLGKYSNYEVAKHALETMSDSLRMEMKKFNVDVTIVEPGMFGFATSGLSEAMIDRMQKEGLEMWSALTPEAQVTYKLQELSHSHSISPVKGFHCQIDVVRQVTDAVTHALCSGSPSTRYLVDGTGTIIPYVDEYNAMARLTGILSTWITDRLVDILPQ